MSKRLINLITAFIILLAVYFGYRYFVTAPLPEEAPGVSVTAGGSAGETSSAEFLDLLLSVKNISLNKNLFDNPIFRDRLQDFSRELPERPIGRPNPFAPFGVGDNGTSTARAATSTKVLPAGRSPAPASAVSATSSMPQPAVDNGINF